MGLVSLAAFVWLTTEPSVAHEPEVPTAAKQAAAQNPRITIAGAAMIGPHAVGNQECRSEDASCETRGGFFGVGTSIEVRLRLASVFSVSVRPWVVGNAAKDKVFGGALGGALGLGAYGRRIFGRAEYIGLHAFGDDSFTPPFFEDDVARARWGNHAGMLSIGFRKAVAERMRIELWGGPMFGPSSQRSFPDGTTDRRTLVTFMLGFGLAFDALPGPWRPRG
ncbi:MAG: hypothetical protein ACRBN8_34715 [Nannocystales bacterium]